MPDQINLFKRIRPFFILGMRWNLALDTETNVDAGNEKTYYFSTFRAKFPEYLIIPAVQEFGEFKDAGININETGMAEILNAEKSLDVTFFDPYGFFWRKFIFHPFYLEDIECDVFVCLYECDGEEDFKPANAHYYLLFRGGVSAQPKYNMDQKTLNITVSTRPYDYKVGFVPDINKISPDDPNYLFLRSFLNQELWPDVYGLNKCFKAVPLMREPAFKTLHPYRLDVLGPGINPLGEGAQAQIFVSTVKGNDAVFIEAYNQSSPAGAAFFGKMHRLVLTGTSADQYGGSFAYLVDGYFDVCTTDSLLDGYDNAVERVNQTLAVTLDLTTLTHYWYMNIPIRRVNGPDFYDPLAYIDPANHYVHVAERIKFEILPGDSTWIAEPYGRDVMQMPWLQHMWVRVQNDLSRSGVQEERGIEEFTAKVVEQVGNICTLDFVNNCDCTNILWAGRAVGPPHTIPKGTRICIYGEYDGNGVPIPNTDLERIRGVYILDTKAPPAITHGLCATEFTLYELYMADGRGYTMVPPPAFGCQLLYSDGGPLGWGGNGFWISKAMFWENPITHEIYSYLPFAHPPCTFVKMNMRDGFLRFLCEEDFEQVGGEAVLEDETKDILSSVYATGETYISPNLVPAVAGPFNYAELFDKCREHKALWGWSGPLIPNFRWDLENFGPYQMSDVEAMNHIAKFWGGIDLYPGRIVSPMTNIDFECYPVHFTMRKQDSVINVLNEISWQKGKVLRDHIVSSEYYGNSPTNLPSYWSTGTLLNSGNTRSLWRVIETIDLFTDGFVGRGGEGIGSIWGNPADHPPSTVPYGITSRATYISSWKRDPLAVDGTIGLLDLTDEDVEFTLSPKEDIITALNADVVVNESDRVVPVNMEANTIQYFGYKQGPARVAYYAYNGVDTVWFLRFWLKRLCKPRLRVTFNTLLNKMHLNMFDIVELQLGEFFFQDPSLGVPPMLRGNLTDATTTAYAQYGDDVEVLSTRGMASFGVNGAFPTYGRIISKRLNLNSGSIQFQVELENIRGYYSSANTGGEQHPAGGTYSIIPINEGFSDPLQAMLPWPFAIMMGQDEAGSTYDLMQMNDFLKYKA